MIRALLLAAQVAAFATGQPADEEGFGGETEIREAAAKDDLPDEEKAALRKRVAEDRARARLLKKEEGSILSGLGELDRALEKQRKREAQLFDKRMALENEIARVDAELAVGNAALEKLREKIGRRAAAIVRLRRTPIGELLSRAQSPAAMRKLRDRLRLVLGYDAKLVAETREASAAAIALRKTLGEREAELDRARAKASEEIEATLSLREERSALLRAVRSERGMVERLAGEIQTAAEKLDQEIGVIRGLGPELAPASGGFGNQRGRLPWPTPGRVEVPFGKRVDPSSGMVMVQKGIDIRAPLAAPIRAIFGGAVAYSDWLQGFGRVVILDHGEGWYSIYGHLESADARKGQTVGQHQVIGYVGDSDSLKGPYLYLEIRQGKAAMDPIGWLAR